MTDGPFKQHLKAARLFGCLLAAPSALGMSFVVFVGSTMGDCEPGPGCHDGDGLHILNGFFWIFIIVSLTAAGTWLVAGFLRMAIRPFIGAVATNIILVAVTLLAVWFCYNPMMELLLAIIAPAAQ